MVSFGYGAGVIVPPRTGQTNCYNMAGAIIACSDTGQDGDVQAGASWPDPRFTPGTGTEAQCITDNLTGLMWPKNGNLALGTWNEAIDYANNFSLCGHSDWRLPNVNELNSLIQASEPDNGHWLMLQGFTDVQLYHYWSSTSTTDPGQAWIVNMYGHVENRASVDFDFKDLYYYLWPVRGGQDGPSGSLVIWRTGQTISYHKGDDGDLQMGVAWPSPRFTDHGDGTVTDNLTGLMWTQDGNMPGPPACGPHVIKNWQGALNHVKCLNAQKYLGYPDWRLPNKTELFSLIDRSQFLPAVPKAAPFDVKPYWYWSSTTLADSTGFAWVVDMSVGIVDNNGKGYRLQTDLWPVRGGSTLTPPLPSLTVSIFGTGTGTVTSSPSGIDCGSACSSTYARNSHATLAAQPGIDSVLSGWSGDCQGKGTCELTMNGDKSVGVAFDKVTCTYTLSPKTKSFTYKGGTIKVNISAKGAPACSPPDVSKNGEWLILSPVTFSENRGWIEITAPLNESSLDRNGTVTIGSSSFPVTQAGKPCTLTLSAPSSPLFSKAGGTGSFNVNVTPHDCPWTSAPSASWIAVTSGDAGRGSGTVEYSVQENTGKSARSGKIKVVLTKNKRSNVFTVKQGNK